MCNVASRVAYAVIIPLALALGGCGQSRQVSPAESLLTQAREASAQGRWDEASALLDSIVVAYPDEIDLCRQAIALRPSVTEGLTIKKLSLADSLAVTFEAAYDSIRRLMVKVDDPQLVEGYWVAAKGRDPRLLSGDGIEARVSLDGELYMVSSLNPSSLGHDSFTLIAADGAKASTAKVPYDGELNYRLNSGEVVTYLGSGCADVAAFATTNASKPLTVVFNGRGSSRKLPISADKAEGLATACRFAETILQLRHWSLERERLNQRLAIARDQRARLNDSVGGQAAR